MYNQPPPLPPMYHQTPPQGYYMAQTAYGGYPPPGGLPPSVPGYSQGYGQPPAPYAPTQPSNGMFTRNLIGSLTVNAFNLNDTESNSGHWFILQDLSVRTEGTFR